MSDIHWILHIQSFTKPVYSGSYVGWVCQEILLYYICYFCGTQINHSFDCISQDLWVITIVRYTVSSYPGNLWYHNFNIENIKFSPCLHFQNWVLLFSFRFLLPMTSGFKIYLFHKMCPFCQMHHHIDAIQGPLRLVPSGCLPYWYQRPVWQPALRSIHKEKDSQMIVQMSRLWSTWQWCCLLEI